jgi:hypothetical protein
MLRLTLALLSFLLLSLVGAAVFDSKVADQPRPPAVRQDFTRPPLSALPLRKVMICLPEEINCRTASYLTWCCRADQSCDYNSVGGCRRR